MSSTHYSKLDNLYTKSEIDTLIENNSGSGGISVDYGPDYAVKYEEIYLGDHITEEQSANIANGTFKGLPLGAYWTINNINYRIMARDIYYATDTLQYHDVVNHHVVVMPDTIYSKQQYNSTETSSGGYASSSLKTYIENTYNPYITSIFGDNHILSHTHDLTAGTYRSGSISYRQTKAWLINSYNIDGYMYRYETFYSWKPSDVLQFPAFKGNTELKAGKGGSWWLGSSSSTYEGKFSYYNPNSSYLGMNYTGAHQSVGVRPAFLVY